MKQAFPILLIMFLVFLTVVGFVTYYIQESLAPIDNKAATTWWNDNWSYRVSFEVDAGEYVRINKPFSTNINLTAALGSLNKSGSVDTDSFRVVEFNSSGDVIDADVPFQFDRLSNFNSSTNASGEIIWILKGETQINSKRYYHLYFDFENKSIPTANIAPLVVTTDNVTHKGYSSIKIETDTGELYYHKLGGGFATFLDQENKDWINWNTNTGANGNFRGIPNMVHPEDGGYFHPGRDTAQTELLSVGPLRSKFRSYVGTDWEIIWEVYPEYSSMKVTKVPVSKKYWFLYEGVPGGTLDLSIDKLTKSDGTSIIASQEWTNDIVNEEWIYVSDGSVNRSLFLTHNQDDEFIDAYYDMETMTVFGFGRQKNSRFLSGVNNTFTIGLVDSKDFDILKKNVESSSKELTATIGSLEFNSSQTSGTPILENTVTPTNSTLPSVTPSSGTPQPSNTPTPRLSSTPTPPLTGNTCGKADIEGDGRFSIADFGEFAKSYGTGRNTCADKDVEYGPCGGRDVNKDGKLNIADFGAQGIGFAQRYFPKMSCALN